MIDKQIEIDATFINTIVTRHELDSRFNQLDSKIDRLDAKFDKKFNQMDAKIDEMNAKIDKKFTLVYFSILIGFAAMGFLSQLG